MNEDLVKYARAALYGVIVIIALAVFLNLGGCASYGKLYERYAQICESPDAQKTTTIKSKDGTTITINGGCGAQPPVDADAKYWNFAGQVSGGVLSEVGSTIRSRHSNDAQKELYKIVGQGGDTITITNNGDSNTTATGGAAAGTAGGNLGNTTTTTTTTTDTNTSTSTSSSSTSASTDGGGSASVD